MAYERVRKYGVLIAFALSTVTSTVAMSGESIQSNSAVQKAEPEFDPTGLPIEEIEKHLNGRELVNKAMRKFRNELGCAGPNFEKNPPARKSTLNCSDALSYGVLKNKLESVAKMCLEGCKKAGLKGVEKRASAAVAQCREGDCQQQCEMNHQGAEAELEGRIKGAILGDLANAAAVN